MLRPGILAAAIVFAIAAASLSVPARASDETGVAERIAAVTGAPQFAGARWGIHAVALDTGETIASVDASRLFVPASNMKLYTTALALARLGPSYRWRTSVYVMAKPDAAGTVRGDLVVYGRGDPTMSERFSSGGALADVELLADRIHAAGVRRVDGDLVGDESYFVGVRFGYGWEWNDLQWGYGAEVSALSVADNVFTLEIAPGARAGAAGLVRVTPSNGYLTLTNRSRTVPKEAEPKLGIYRAEGSNAVDVWGSLPAGSSPTTATVAVHDPAAHFAHLLRGALARRHVEVRGKTTSADARLRELRPFDTSRAIEVAHVESEPLADVIRETNKESQNLYAELLLRTVGRVRGPADAESTEAAGIAVLREFLEEAGVDPESVALADGSGLSRRDLVTPEATVKLLVHARRQPWSSIFFSSLPEAGLDGTLGRRFKETEAVGRVRAKTGTRDGVSSLAGYLVTKSNRPVAFAVMVNNATGPVRGVREAIDAVVLALLEAPARKTSPATQSG